MVQDSHVRRGVSCLHDGHAALPSRTPVAGLEGLLERLFPGARVVSVKPMRPDEAASDEAAGDTLKAAGYGFPVRISLRERDGSSRSIVWHIAAANDFGHDRRSDRAQELLLAYDTFGGIPAHVRALDVGAILPGGELVSLARAGEFYLLTSYAEGTLYADDLRRIAQAGRASPLDASRCDALAHYLAALHVGVEGGRARYVRAIRDLVGHGEGIFGLIDAYPPDVAGAPPSRLRAIERRCVDWRWRLRERGARLARIHGDFHPFNVVFDSAANVSVLDASRGCIGDAADDVSCMALNYVFFALDHPTSWPRALGPLWHRFWSTYLATRPDGELLAIAPPFLAWRALVMSCPAFYPAVDAGMRDRLLTFVEGALDSDRFDPDSAEQIFQ